MAKIFTSAFVVLLLWLTSCSQTNARNIDKHGKIPIDPHRWYQLNNTSGGLEELFNGKEQDKINIGRGAVLKNYDSYYPLFDDEQMTIDSIMLFDWEGTNEQHPMTIYAILKDWSRVTIAVFTGESYNEWVGPDPKQPHTYALSKPVSNIRGLVINSWGDFPGEIEFYGPYVRSKSFSKREVKYAPLKNFFGINAFEWDFEAPEKPMQLDPQRIAVIKNFTGVRHYMDWEKLEGIKGSYAFSPTYNGSWNYDTMYQWCKEQNIEVLGCLKTIPGWMQASYPDKERDNENTPMQYGKDPADPLSYLEQAKAAFQYAARYGRNKNINPDLLPLERGNNIRTGLNLVAYIECDNERDKWWKGRKAYQTGREYAANLSAFYDGNQNRMGPGVGVKNADPTMKVVMAGLARPSTDYVRGMIDWCKEHRGNKPDGSIDLPWDIINYHFYANDANTDLSKSQTTGIAPELAKADSFANEFINMAHLYAGDMPVWITETGYDLHPNSPQKAPAINGKSAEEIQADWILRTSLLYASSGIQKVFFYQLYDDNPGSSTKYATCGLVNKNKKNKIASDFLYQTNKLFGSYTYKETISKNPRVDRYAFNGTDMFMLVSPTQKGRTATYSVNLGNAATAMIYKPKAGSMDMDMMKKKTNGGKVEIAVSETPVFVVAAKKG